MNQVLHRLNPYGLVIFLLHGVTDQKDYEVRNYTGKHVYMDDLKDLMVKLKANGQALSMDDIIEMHNQGTPYPARSFAVTLDDGYENNYSIAAPIFEELDIPATFYIPSEWIETNIMSFLDTIELALEDTPQGSLRLPWYDYPLEFQTKEDKIALMQIIRQFAKIEKNIDLIEFTKDVCRQCDHDYIDRNDSPLDKKMTWKQVRELNEHPLFTVGGHSHTHIVMTFHDQQGLDFEVETSLRMLKENADVAPTHYSYPVGLEDCYDENVISTLKANGVVCCPTAIDGINTVKTPLFELRRIMVG